MCPKWQLLLINWSLGNQHLAKTLTVGWIYYDGETRERNMARRYSLQDIRRIHRGLFFDPERMAILSAQNVDKPIQETTYAVEYDRKTGINYVVVTDPWGNPHYHKFDPDTGGIVPVPEEETEKITVLFNGEWKTISVKKTD
jgi:hypothetical protein